MGLARKRGWSVEERRVRPEELVQASEVFLCGTAAEIVPVGSVDGHHYQPGPVARTLMADFQKLVREPDCEDFGNPRTWRRRRRLSRLDRSPALAICFDDVRGVSGFRQGSRAETVDGAEPFEPDPGHAGEGTGVHRLAKSSIIVIGAGVAGLSCALELAERGLTVDVVERAGTLGAASCSWMAGGMLAPWCERATTEPEVLSLGPSVDRLVGAALCRNGAQRQHRRRPGARSA